MRLPLERLERLLVVLNRQGGTETVRQLARLFSIWSWEIEAAESLGWVEIETRKPRIGRPSRIVRKRELNETIAAKLPPFRFQLGKEITFRHEDFAWRSVYTAAPRGIRSFGFPPIVAAYLAAFPQARSRSGAAASASRLMRHPNVKAARAWFYAQANSEIPKGERMPRTASEIWQRLRELGSWRSCSNSRILA